MKKFFTIIALSAMTLSFSSYSLPETPSDCVRESLAIVESVADEFGDDLNGEFKNFYMAEYLDMYESCVNSL